jgi:hypothetical protein
MRKILLATTAFVGVALAGSVQAAPTSPITLNVGGYDDFVAGLYHEAQGVDGIAHTANHDFENEFKINFDATGKGSNGIEYGANVSLWNGSEEANLWEGGGTNASLNSAYVWLSGAFGKALFGDEHGASDLFVYAPTVGEGQIDGRYRDFVDSTHLAYFQPSGIDNTEHSTKITYYTPKIGNENNKVQLGLSYIPQLYNYGQSVVTSQNGANSNTASAYQDVVKAALQYTGNFHPVNVTVSGQLISGNHSAQSLSATTLGGVTTAGNSDIGIGRAQDFTSWGLGTQVGFNGWTFGGSYTDQGRYNTISGQNKDQDVFTLGAKYEFDKVGVAAGWLSGKGYANYLAGATGATTSTTNYVGNFEGYSAGATYTWFPGLTSNLDGVFFTQKDDSVADHNDGYVLLFSQRLAF